MTQLAHAVAAELGFGGPGDARFEKLRAGMALAVQLGMAIGGPAADPLRAGSPAASAVR